MGNEETRLQMERTDRRNRDANISEKKPNKLKASNTRSKELSKKHKTSTKSSDRVISKYDDRISRSGIQRSKRSHSRSRYRRSRSNKPSESRRSHSRSRYRRSRSKASSESRRSRRSKRSHSRSKTPFESQRSRSRDLGLENHNIIDKTSNETEVANFNTRFYCKDCDCHATGYLSFKQHLLGKQHLHKSTREYKGTKDQEFAKGKFVGEDCSKSIKRSLDLETAQTEIKGEKHFEIWDKINSNEKVIKRIEACMPVNNSEVKEVGICDKGIAVCEKSIVSEKETVSLLKDRVEASIVKDAEEETNLMNNKGIESGQDNIVGLDYVLVIHKHGKSWFQCFLCDTRTLYENHQQLKDHVLELNHQRAYMVELEKGPIKIKRLKSRNSEKRCLDQRIEQKLFHPAKATEPTFESSPQKSSTDSGDSTYRKRSTNPCHFLKKTMKQVHLHNRIYEEKLNNRKRSRSLPDSETDTKSKASSPPRVTAQSSSLSLTSLENMSLEGESVIPQDRYETPSLVELVGTLSVEEVLKLALLKLKNAEVTENDIPYLNELVDATVLLKSRLEKEKLNELDSVQPHRIDYDSGSLTAPLQSEENSYLLKLEKLDEIKPAIPCKSVVVSSKPTRVNVSFQVKSSDALEEKSPSVQKIDMKETITLPAIQVIDISSDDTSDENVTSTVKAKEEKANGIIQPPDSFWESLPTNDNLLEIVNILNRASIKSRVKKCLLK